MSAPAVARVHAPTPVVGTDVTALDGRCRAAGEPVLPVLLDDGTTVIGPLYDCDDGPCLLCFEYRRRLRSDAPNLTHRTVRLGGGVPEFDEPALRELVLRTWDDALLGDVPWRTVVVIDGAGVHRHRLWRSVGCYRGHDDGAPAAVAATDGPDLTDLRADRFVSRADRQVFARSLVDHLVGPVTGIGRVTDAAAAMSAAVLPQSRNVGYGRGTRYADSDFIAVMEAWERMCGHPFDGARVLTGAELPEDATVLGETELGGYHPRQLADPSSRIDPGAQAFWVAAHTLDGAATAYVPAEVAFYNFTPQHGADYHGARRGDAPAGVTPSAPARTVRYDESSSGAALGSSFTEAALHALCEVLERDAFLRFWYGTAECRRVLVDPADAESALLRERIAADGFTCELVRLPGPTALPTVGAFAFHRTGGHPFVLCAAGSGPRWADAVRSGLWELVNLAAAPRPRSAAETARRLPDRWAIRTIEDHVDYYALPENGRAVAEKCRGPQIVAAELPDLGEVIPAARRGPAGHVIRTLAEQLASADLGAPHFVDQTNLELRDQGLWAAKCVVPGALSMTFGTAHQRVRGLETLRGLGRADLLEGCGDLAPHPFP